MTARTVLKVLEAHRKELADYGVKRLGLFGSVAKGTATSHSDLDFVVDFDHKTFDKYMDVKFYLERLFRRHVDLVLTDALKPRLRKPVLKEALYLQGF